MRRLYNIISAAKDLGEAIEDALKAINDLQNLDPKDAVADVQKAVKDIEDAYRELMGHTE